MKKREFRGMFLVLAIFVLFTNCKEDGFPVPPASTVPLFSYTYDNDGFAPATFTFTNESIVPENVGTASFSWEFGDGGKSTEISPIHLYAMPGVFEVKLIVKTSISLEIKEHKEDIVIKNKDASGIPVYFTNGSLVYTGFVNEDKPVFSPLPIGPFGDSYDLEIDTINSKLYIGDFDNNKIYQCDLDGSNLIDFRIGANGPDGLAIDYANNRLYWDTNDGIKRADLSSTDVNQMEDFATGQSALDPEGVSIDPINNKVYWTYYNDGGGVMMKSIDGSGGETAINSSVAGGSTLVVGNRIFYDQWIATGDIHLKSANLDGSAISTITTGITKVVFGIGYEPEGNKIYWGDRSAGKIMRANLDGSSIETWFESAGSSPRGIVFGKKKQKN